MLVLAVGTTISIGITTSAPNTKENGVWPVAFFGVMLSAQRTKGSSSAHLNC